MSWLFHDSHQIFYRSPFGAVTCKQQIKLRVRVNPQLEVDRVFLVIWKEGEEPQEIAMGWLESEPAEDSIKGEAYQVQISSPETPCLLWYYFMVKSQGQIYYSENTSKPHQITVYRENVSTPNWFKESIVYQIFVDRFYNGCEDGAILNPKKKSLIHGHWDDTPFYIRDENSKVIRWNFFGGNLLGIIKKLPYLKELGITTIYFNPIFEAPSNHKYDTADYKNIDAMFGDNEIFETLCQIAKGMGISIILDGVFSHTGNDSIYFNKKGKYPQLGAYQSPESPYYSWYRFREYPHKYECWWDAEELPNVNEMEPTYQDFIIHNEDSVIKTWMKKGAKGWRLDVADELPSPFLKMFNKTMKKQDPDSILIGEVWEDASNKVSYGERRKYFLGDELDSVTNYPFRDILLKFALGETDAKDTHLALMNLYENYPIHHFYSTLNLLGSHDVPRILTLLREKAIPRLKLLSLFQMTFPGVPCIYYGDEVGMEGGEDPYCRGTYPWGRENLELLTWYKKIISLRNQYDMLRTGEWLPLFAEDDVYGYIRRISQGRDVFHQPKNNGLAVVLLNRSINREVSFRVDLSKYDLKTLVDILANSEEILLPEGQLSLVLKPMEGKVLVT